MRKYGKAIHKDHHSSDHIDLFFIDDDQLPLPNEYDFRCTLIYCSANPTNPPRDDIRMDLTYQLEKSIKWYDNEEDFLNENFMELL